MPVQLQISLVIGSILFLAFLINQIRKSKFSIELAVVWVAFGFGIVLISLFPEFIYTVSAFIGVLSPINAVYLVMIFFSYVLLFFAYLRISRLEDQIKNLAHVIAMLKKETDDEGKK